MRAVKALCALAVAAAAARAVGFLLMARDGYQLSGPFSPAEGTLADTGLALVVLAELGLASWLLLTWIVLSANVMAARDRLAVISWDHGKEAIWLWFVVPVAFFWKPRQVYLEILTKARPSDPDGARSAVSQWWGWLLAFLISTGLTLVPGEAWYPFGVSALTAVLGVVATVKLARMLELLTTPETPYSTVPAMAAPRGVMPTTPGWYHDPEGRSAHQAWWDGTRWTGATRPDPGQLPQVVAETPRTVGKVVVAVVVGFVVLVAVMAAVAVIAVSSAEDVGLIG
jgi:hypothetical protein